jgi:signal transduction histidine kinase
MEINPVHLLNHQIVRDLPFGVIVVDRELRINDWNSWMEKSTGLSRPRVQGKLLIEFFPDLESRNLLEPVMGVFETGHLVDLPCDKLERFLDFKIVPNREQVKGMIQDTEIRPLFDIEGEVAAACLIVHDVTERVQRLQELERLNRDFTLVNEALEAANRVKSEFLANTSHELRTPLTGILGFVEILENDLADSPEEEKEFLANIRVSASHLLETLNKILQTAAVAAGKTDIEIRPVSLVEILADVHASNHPIARQQNLDFAIQLDDLDLEVLADYQELRQVLMNVVDNSLKFTDEGWITLSAHRCEQDHERVMIVVQDTGIGIESDKMDLVFQPFGQVDSSSRRKSRGTGLGLSISRAAMERMKGTIEIESEGLGKGTTVRLSLPSAIS